MLNIVFLCVYFLFQLSERMFANIVWSLGKSRALWAESEGDRARKTSAVTNKIHSEVNITDGVEVWPATLTISDSGNKTLLIFGLQFH